MLRSVSVDLGLIPGQTLGESVDGEEEGTGNRSLAVVWVILLLLQV